MSYYKKAILTIEAIISNDLQRPYFCTLLLVPQEHEDAAASSSKNFLGKIGSIWENLVDLGRIKTRFGQNQNLAPQKTFVLLRLCLLPYTYQQPYGDWERIKLVKKNLHVKVIFVLELLFALLNYKLCVKPYAYFFIST